MDIPVLPACLLRHRCRYIDIPVLLACLLRYKYSYRLILWPVETN